MASGIRKIFRIPPLSMYYFKRIYIIIYNSAKCITAQNDYIQ